MADISTELSALGVAANGAVTRSYIVSAIQKIQSDMSAFAESFQVETDRIITILDQLESPVIGSDAVDYDEIVDGIKIIGSSAFYGNSYLSAVAFPAVEKIETDAFNGCMALKTASFPLCSIIGSSAFYSCSALQSISIPIVSTISTGAFMNCSSLASISISTLSIVGQYAFSGCSQLSVVNAQNVTTISGAAFEYCYALESAYFPNLRGTLGTRAFDMCVGLANAELGSVSYIGSSAFQSCSALSRVSASGVVRVYEYAFDGCSKLEQFPLELLESIGSYAFRNAFVSGIGLTFPVVSHIDDYAFSGCSINGASFTVLSQVNASAFSGAKIKNLIFPSATSMRGTFRSNVHLEVVNLPMLSIIPSEAFRGCTKLRQVNCTLVTAVNRHAFSGCSSLTGMVLPNVTVVWSEAFEGAFTKVIQLNKASQIWNRGIWCSKASQIYLLSTAVVSLPDAIDSTAYTQIVPYPTSVQFVVRSSLVSKYKTTWPWSDLWNIYGQLNPNLFTSI